jgi:hypothetical protein
VVFGGGADLKSCLACKNYSANKGSRLKGRKYTQIEASVHIYLNKIIFILFYLVLIPI